MRKEPFRPTDIKEITSYCSQTLTQIIKIYSEFGTNILSVDLMADFQKPI